MGLARLLHAAAAGFLISGCVLLPGPAFPQTVAQPAPEAWDDAKAQPLGAYVFLGPAGVREVQLTLNRLKFRGPVDGQWSPATAQAAAAFQRKFGLAPTGTLTLQLLDALRLGRLVTAPAPKRIPAAGAGAGPPRAEEAPPGPGVVLQVGPVAIRRVQEKLLSAGFDPGPIEGVWTEATAGAAAMFQRAQGLVPTGLVDVELIAALETVRPAENAPVPSGPTGPKSVAPAATAASVNLVLGPAVVSQIQIELNRRGFAAGTLTGNWSLATQGAMEAFQRSAGLEPTGTPTTEALSVLGLQSWLATAEAGLVPRRAPARAPRPRLPPAQLRESSPE